MPWLRPLQEYRPGALARSTRPSSSSPRASRSAAMLPGPPLAAPAARRCCSASLGARRIRFVAEFALLSAPIVACAVTRRRRPRDGAHDRGAAPELGRIATVARRRAVRRRGDRAARRTPRGGASAPSTSASIRRWSRRPRSRFVERQRPARPDVQRHGGRLVPDLGGLAAPPRLPGPAHQRLPARVPRHASPRRPVARGEWDALLAGFGVTTALVTYPAENPRAAFFDPDRWALVYRAADGLVFVGRGAQLAALIARAEIP